MNNSSRKTQEAGKSGTENQNAIELLKADHREVEQLFEQFKSAKGRQQRRKLVKQIATALNAHTIIEEEIFYQACSEHGVEEDQLDEAQVEHDTVKLLVRELLENELDDDYYDAKVTVLSEYVKHHVKEEEEPEKGIFARLEKTDADLADLGRELKQRKEELMEDSDRLVTRPPRIRSLYLDSLSSASRSSWQRSSEDREQRGQSAHREDFPRGASRGADIFGAEEGSGYYRGSDRDWREREHYDDRYEDQPQRSYRSDFSEGRGGWYGDPRGHSEAARRGWRHRED